MRQTNVLDMFASAVMLFDKEVYGDDQASIIILSTWDATAQCLTHPFLYVQDRAVIQAIPPAHLKRHLIPTKSDFFVLFAPCAYRQLARGAKRSLTFL